MHDPGTITTILQEARGGSREAVDRLFPLLDCELRGLARAQLGVAPRDRTLDTTALIHEAYLRMVDQTRVEWPDRAHFFGYAARAMRSVLVDYARKRNAGKRGAGAVHLSLEDRDVPIEDQAEAMVALDEALMRLAQVSERLCRVVECRFFGGLTEIETAGALGVSDRTVRRDWLKAKAWLKTELAGDAAR